MSDYRTIATACGETYAYARTGEVLSDSWDVKADCVPPQYFTEGTRRFFGSHHFRTVAPGVSVETQDNAPGDRFHVTAWRAADGGVEPWLGCWHSTRRQAVACARRTSIELTRMGVVS